MLAYVTYQLSVVRGGAGAAGMGRRGQAAHRDGGAHEATLAPQAGVHVGSHALRPRQSGVGSYAVCVLVMLAALSLHVEVCRASTWSLLVLPAAAAAAVEVAQTSRDKLAAAATAGASTPPGVYPTNGAAATRGSCTSLDATWCTPRLDGLR